MNLHVYLQNLWIKRHQTSAEEVAKLLAIAARDIRQCKVPGIEPEWRFDIAYNAALQLAVAALAAAGYQAERQNKHQRTVESLQFFLLPAADVRFLNDCRRKRNSSVYEEIGMISDAEAHELIAFTERFEKLVRSWIAQNHPKLLPP